MDRGLAGWVLRQRQNALILSKEQIQRLNDLGFNWETQAQRFDRAWKENFDKLDAYRQEHGNCHVKLSEDPVLARWVTRQRSL